MIFIPSIILSKKRIPTHIVVAVSAWIGRIISASVQLISVRILLTGLGSDKYALFALLVGMTGWFMLGDLGIGSSLQNFISERRAENKSYDSLISISALISFLLLLGTLVLFYILTPYMAPVILKQFKFLTVTDKDNYFFIIGSILIITAIGNISYKIWYAFQKGYISNILPGIASLISLLGMYWVFRSNIENKLFISLVIYVFPAAIISILSFFVQIYKIPLKRENFDRAIIKQLFNRAIKFWVFSLMSAFVLQIDYLIMSQFVSTVNIVIYNILSRIYMLIGFVYTAILSALWPVFTELILKRKWATITGILNKYLLIGGLFIMGSIATLIPCMPYIVKLVSPKNQIIIPATFILLYGFYSLLRTWTDTYTMVLQSMSKMRSLLIWVPIQAVISVGLQILFVPKFGIYGVIYGLIGSYILTVSWVLPKSVRLYIKKAEGL